MIKKLIIPSITTDSLAKKACNALFSFAEVEEITVDTNEGVVILELSSDISDNELKKTIKSSLNCEVEDIV